MTPLFCRVEGDGPAVLLLNGVSMTLAAWEPVARALIQQGRTVVRCDLRGQLRSPGPPPATVGGHIEDILPLLDRAGLRQVDVMGTSFGAALSLRLAHAAPDRVGAVVATTVGPGNTPVLRRIVDGWKAACDEVVSTGNREAFYDRFSADLFSPTFRREHPGQVGAFARQVARLPERWFQDLRGLLDTAGLGLSPQLLREITAPTLIMAAGDDALVPMEDAARLAAQIPGARFELVPRAGHALLLENPHVLTRLAARFLSGP